MDWKARIPVLVLWLALVFSFIEGGNTERRIVCYYTNWSVYRPGTAKFSPQNINPYLCTHLIYAFGGFTKDNTLKPFDKYQDIEKGGYAKFTGLKTYNKNLKTMLAIGGWNEGSSRFSSMVADPERRKEFVKNSVKFLRQNHFDGLDLDWEYPAFRDGGKPRDRNNYADLVQELREEFEKESSKTGRKRLLLSMAVPAGIEYIDKGYDIPRLNDYLDFINLLSYDYHSAFEPAVNHHSPLYPLEEDNEYNYDTELTIDYTIRHLLKSGASSEKIVLGIPTYGRSYTLINEDATDIGAPADGPGEEGDATREKGYLAYYEICESIGKSEEWEVVQPNQNAMGPYAFREKQWVGYDDEDIVRAKARYAIDKKLGGIMFWSIDNDDFRGKCHGRPYPLIEAAKEALLIGNESSNSGQKTKLLDNRKKTRIQGGHRIQGNTISRKLSVGNRRMTTQAPATRRRASSSRSKAQSNARSNIRSNNSAEDDEEEDDDEEEANAVKAAEKPRTRIRSKSQSNNRVISGGRRKQQQNSRQTEERETNTVNVESLSNSLTTPEPPTTPDPGSDFKCEDEGFFSHPRDCKKYFWCLDSGPGGLGIVAHQFTCPSGLVFNKAADSCDYPRNVVCKKKTSQSTVTSTKAPTTAASSRTTHKPTKRTTTPKTEGDDEEYEYYDDEEVEDSEEAEEVPPTTATSKPLQYKTISRSRPTTTPSTSSTTPTEATILASTISYKTTPDRVTSFEDEEDPRVLKELIDLIKKAGGIEQLEKQLHYQEKNSGGNGDRNENNGKPTPATISRSLYERVLGRQATKIAGSFLGSLSTPQSANGDKAQQRATKNSRTGFVNGPGAQFEGLDNIPEVKSLRRSNKPQYVTIERHRSSTSESPAEKDEEDEGDVDDDNTNVASLEDRAVSDSPQEGNTNRRVTPSYVNIRRPRPSTTTSENDVEMKDENFNAEDPEEEEEPVTQRHRIVKTEEESSSPKSRYTNIHRFRSTTSRNNEVDETDEVIEKNEITTEAATVKTTTTIEKVISVTEHTVETLVPSTTTLQSSKTSESFSTSTLEQSSTSDEPSSESSTALLTTDSSLKLVEESATEILFTTAPASSSLSANTSEPPAREPSIAAVSQPRPFGFLRRGRPTASTTSSTSFAASLTEPSRPKVDSETLRLPTLKELVSFSTAVTESIADLTSTFVLPTTTVVNTTIDNKALRYEHIDRAASKNRFQNLIQDLRDENNDTENNYARKSSRDKKIFDNDVLESEEVQQRSSSSSLAAAAAAVGVYHTKSTKDSGEINDTNQSIKQVDIPVKILNDIDGEEIAELVLLRLPENKLNSAILKPVFRVKILESDQKGERKDNKRNGIESNPTSAESSSENELSGNRRQPLRRRRVRINNVQGSPIVAITTNESDSGINDSSHPLRRQRIVKARRRPYNQEASLDRSGERILGTEKDEQSVRVQGDGKISRRFDSVDIKLENITSTATYPTETSTTIRVTTIRGNLPTSSKPSSVSHGFYITRESDETSTPYRNASMKELSIDSTKDPLTMRSDVINESTQRTNFATQNHESSMSQVERIYPTTEESSTYESTGTTFREAEITARVANEIDSLGILLKSTSNNFKIVTSDRLSTIEDMFTESFTAMIMTTTEEEGETSEKPSITTFRLFNTIEPASNLTIPVDSTTPEYLTDGKTEAIDKYTVTNVDEYTGHFAETLKTSEKSHYRFSPILEVTTSTVPMTIELDENDVSIKTQTEIPIRRTTNLIDKATTYMGAFERGKARFTTISKLGGTSLGDHLQKTTNSPQFLDSRIDLVSESVASERNNNFIKVHDKKVEPMSTTVKDIGSSYTSRTSVRSRGRQRSTSKIFQTDDSKIHSVNLKESALQSGAEVEISDGAVQYTSTTEADRLSTNFMEITDSSYSSRSSHESERGKQTRKSFEANDIKVNSVTPIEFMTRNDITTEVYDKTMEPTITIANINDLSTNFVETTGISYISRSSLQNSKQPQITMKFLEADDVRIKSEIPVEFASINDISTKVYDKTIESIITSTEAIDLSTSFVEITESSYTSRLPSTTHDDHERTTTLFDADGTTIASVSPRIGALIEVNDNNEEYTTRTGETEERTKSNMPTSKHDDDPQITTKSFETQDSTTVPMTPIELTVPSNITTEPYDTALHNSSGNAKKITGSRLYTTSQPENNDSTTETYEKTTDSLHPASTLSFVTTQKEVNPIELTNSGETTVALSVTTRPWVYNQRRNVTRNTENNEFETVNISSDATLTSGVVTSLATFAPMTQVYAQTENTLTAMETGTADIQINEQQTFSTEALQSIKEVTTTLEVNNVDKTKVTKQSYSTTTSSITINDKSEKSTIIPADTIIENIESTTIPATKITSSSKNNYDLSIARTTIQNNDKNTYFTANSSYNSVTPLTPHETKRIRGRVKFINFAGHTDEAGKNRKPVKQMVVRRRLANSPSDQHHIENSTEANISSNQYKIEEKDKAKKGADILLAEDKKNSTKSVRRRVVVYRGRPRAESITTTTVQSASISSDNVSENAGRTERKKWRKRLVLKRARTDDMDDQSIAETGDIRQVVIIDSVDEDARPLGLHIIETMGHELVNFTEGKKQNIGDGEVNIYKSSGGSLRRPGTLKRPEGFNRPRTKSPGTSLSTTQVTDPPAPFYKIRPVETAKDVKTEDQSGGAQELAVTLADPPKIGVTASIGRLPFRTTTRKISTTIAPRTEAPATSRTTPISRRRQRPRGNSNNDKIIESIPTRPRRPAIIDYDYYVDDEVRLVVKPELKDKLFVTRKGGIRCLDQGNFAHPTSCKKFITCARMVNGQVLGTEYTCPDKLSFDPVGGICNWSAGLGCEDKPTA